MNEHRYDEVSVEREARGVAPIFQLLGEGRLGSEALHAVIALLEAEGLPTVPAARQARACKIVSRPRPTARPGIVSGARGALRHLLATLVVDLRPRARPVGVRGAPLSGCRLLFTADGYEVVVQESTDAKRRRRNLVGQILRHGEPIPNVLVVLAGTGQQDQTEADPEGSFRFQNVTGGRYEMQVRAGDDLIVCTPVTLDEQ